MYFVILLTTIFFTTHSLAQQNKPLLEINLTAARSLARSDGPLPVTMKITWNGNSILRGKIHLTVNNSFDNSYTYTTEPLALTPGENIRHIFLPAIKSWSMQGQNVSVVFDRDGKLIRLPDAIINASATQVRSTTIAALNPSLGQSDFYPYQSLLDSLRLTRFMPKQDLKSLACTSISLTPDNLPSKPIALCQFDLILIPGQGFAQLSRDQLTAITQWTRAGGSIIIVADTPLASQHIAFLNSLAEASPAKTTFNSDYTSRLIPPDTQPVLLNVDLGRAVITTTLPHDDQYDSPTWRNATAFLWKIKAKQSSIISQNNSWRTDLERVSFIRKLEQQRTNSNFNSSNQFEEFESLIEESTPPLDYDTHSTLGIEELTDLLQPTAMKMIPISSIFFILLLFTFIIGPVDYFTLKLIRKRILTWFTFPLAAVLFTGATIALANHYLGTNDQNTSIKIIDLGHDNRILRENTIDLNLSARPRASITRLKQALITVLNQKHLINYNFYTRSAYPSQSNPTHTVFQGRYPYDYNTVTVYEQWVPVISRKLTIAPEQSPLPIDFSRIDPLVHGGGYITDKLSDELTAQNFPGIVRIFNKYDADQVIYYDHAAMQPRLQNLNDSMPYRKGTRMHTIIRSALFLLQLSSRQPEGFFSVASQISPACDPYFEDLTIFDSTNPKQILLVAVTSTDNQITLYRKLYHGK